MTTLENLWHGNIRPVEQFVEGNAEYRNLLRLVGNNREKLEATLTPEQAKLFEKYYTSVNEWIQYPKPLHLHMALLSP